MKAFVISLLILGVIIALIMINGIYVSNKTDELECIALTLTPETSDEFFTLYNMWSEIERIFCLSISHKDIDNLNIALSVLKEKYESKEDDGFYEYKALLINYIREIRNKEALSLDTVM